MTKHLYKSFLDNKAVYAKTVKFWKSNCIALFKQHKLKSRHWLSTKFANGVDFMDGNPVYSLYFPAIKKAFRIIQTRQVNDNAVISGWLDKSEIDGKIIDELVITLELSEESKIITDALLSSWIIRDLKLSEMQVLINNIPPQFDDILKREFEEYLVNEVYSMIRHISPFNPDPQYFRMSKASRERLKNITGVVNKVLEIHDPNVLDVSVRGYFKNLNIYTVNYLNKISERNIKIDFYDPASRIIKTLYQMSRLNPDNFTAFIDHTNNYTCRIKKASKSIVSRRAKNRLTKE